MATDGAGGAGTATDATFPLEMKVWSQSKAGSCVGAPSRRSDQQQAAVVSVKMRIEAVMA